MRISHSYLLLVLCALAAASCSQKMTLIHPETGATAECSATGHGLLAAGMPTIMEVCEEKAQKQGYVPVENLTSEQRADLERRGLLPK
jgi:hypothetical protein